MNPNDAMVIVMVIVMVMVIFDLISSNINEVLLINPSANLFVFGDFNIHHKEWLTYSGATDRPGEICHSFSISNDLTYIVNFPTWIPKCDSHSPALLDFVLSSNASICSAMALAPWEIQIMLFQFPVTFQ